jgi:hypothetical protein
LFHNFSSSNESYTIFLNLQGIEYIQKIENLIRLPLGRKPLGPVAQCAWPALMAPARPVCAACAAHGHGTGSARAQRARPASRQAGLDLSSPRRRGAACKRTPERSPLFGHVSRCGRWRRHSGGGGTNGGARALTAERLPAGHGGGGENRLGGGVFLTR